MIRTDFYRELGKFLYAIAYSDGRIQNQETEKLDKAIAHEQSHSGAGEFEELVLTKLSFYTCVRNHLPANDASGSFIDFLKKYAGTISSHDRKIASRLIRKAARAYHGESPGEQQLEQTAIGYLKTSAE